MLLDLYLVLLKTNLDIRDRTRENRRSSTLCCSQIRRRWL